MSEPGIGIAASTEQPAPARTWAQPSRLLPGLALAGGMALAAIAIQRLSGITALSPLIVAVLAGIAVASFARIPDAAKPGLELAVRPLLRLAIVLLGAQLTLAQVASIGFEGIAVVVLTVTATFVFTSWLGGTLGVEPALARMIAAGTSICGASAVIATNAATGGRSDQVATAIACVTLFGTVAMLGFPLLAGPLGLDAHDYGVWSGVAVHEVAQAVATGFAGGDLAGETATVTKLARVMMLLPVLLALGFTLRRKAPAQASRPPLVPGFVLGFAAMVLFNSVVDIPPAVRDLLVFATTLLMATALAAVGLGTDLRRLASGSARPMLLGFLSFLFVAAFGMMLVKILL